MKRKKKSFFLPVILAAGLLLGACNNTPTPVNPPVVETTYTVSFNANGGTGTMASVSDVSGEYTLPECTFTAPTGKHFVGWKVNNQGNLLQPGAKVTISADTQIVAQWELTTYTVSFGANGGSGEMAAVANIVGAYTLPACSFTAPEGKRFVGWKVNGEGETKAVGASINVETNVQLVAQWELIKYTVSFKANGGTGEMAAVADQLGEYTLPENGFTAPEGKHFAGWKVNGEGETLQPGAKIQVTANVEIVAQWEITTYTVSFNANEGTGEMADVTSVVGEYTLPACTFVAPTGYHFGGWKVGGLGDALQPGANITVNSNVSLVAHWELTKYTVSFVANGGTGEMAAVADQLGEYTLPENGFTAPEGKHFTGWKVGGEGDLLEAGAKINVTADTRIVAQYDINVYTVVYKNGDTVLQTEQVNHGEKAPAYAGDTPTKAPDASADKYRFAGWDKDLDAKITANTTINATYAPYSEIISVDDFENYKNSAALAKAGWVALGYNSETKAWTEETKAAVSLGTKSAGGEQALRFDAWRNGNGYKFKKSFEKGQFTHDANLLKYSLMVPAGMTVKVLLYAELPITDKDTQETSMMEVQFNYTYTTTSGEYVEYKIPFDDAGWAAWGDAAAYGTLPSLAKAAGLHPDDIVRALTKIEFYLQGSTVSGNSYIGFFDNFKFVTVDNPKKDAIEEMGQYTRYTGKAASGNIVKLELGAAGAATATVLDLETPMSIPGTIAVENKTVTFTSTTEGVLTYVGELVNGGQTIKGVSSDGTMKDSVGTMDLQAVQVVENFEQYTEEGTLWYQNNKDNPEQRSGARGAYYAEYYAGSGSAPWGGNNWSLMGGSGDQVKLKTDGGHSGKNYLALKNSSGNAMRYMQWGLYDGSSEKNTFRGSKLGFWINTYNRIPEIKVSMYSTPNPTASTINNDVKTLIINPEAQIGSWTHYEVELNPDLVYYGFMIFMEKSQSGADAWLRIDDIEVYNENPYAKYQAPLQNDLELTPKLSYSGVIAGQIRAQLDITDDTNLVLRAPGLNMNVNGTYEIVKDEITMTLADTTVYKATLSLDTKKMTFKSVTGSSIVAGALNGLSFGRIEYADNAELYADSGTMYYQSNKDEASISGARGAYFCDYYSNNDSDSSALGGKKWSLMGGSGDQLSLDTTTGADGSNSLKLKRSSGGMRYTQWSLYKGTAAPRRGFNRFIINLKNSGATDITAKIYVYKVCKVTASNNGDSNRVVKEVTIKAGQDWTPTEIVLDSNTTYYGYGIYLAGAATVNYLNVDKAYFCNADSNPELNFFAKNGVTLSGELNDGVAASMKFTSVGKMKITCAALQLSDVEVSYTMAVNGENKQIMTFSIGSGDNVTTIKGVFAVAVDGTVTFKITEASGAMAAQIKLNNVFTNAAA